MRDVKEIDLSAVIDALLSSCLLREKIKFRMVKVSGGRIYSSHSWICDAAVKLFVLAFH
jgi:hypothetical protein